MYSVLETEGERIKYLYEMHTNLNKSIVSIIIVVFFDWWQLNIFGFYFLGFSLDF